MTRDSQQDEKSRAQVKREFRELKELGKQLAGLPAARLRAMPLSEKTRTALLATRGMVRGALQRQYRYLSSLLAEEEEDVAALRAALAGEHRPHLEEVAAFRELERWRDQLLAGDDRPVALIMERFPACDRTQLRRLVRQAQKEHELQKPPKSARELFRYLRQLSEQA